MCLFRINSRLPFQIDVQTPKGRGPRRLFRRMPGGDAQFSQQVEVGFRGEFPDLVGEASRVSVEGDHERDDDHCEGYSAHVGEYFVQCR